MLKLSDDGLYDADNNATKLHAQFIYVKNYCTDDKIKQWKKDKVSMLNRWTEYLTILKRMIANMQKLRKLLNIFFVCQGRLHR